MAAKTIINKKNRENKSGKGRTIASQRDGEILLDAIVNADKPNNELISAVKLYEKVITEHGLQ